MMKPERQTRILRTARERGFLSEEQVRECTQANREDPLRVAVDRGFLTQEEVLGLGLVGNLGPADDESREAGNEAAFGRYRLETKIGEGAAAVVWRASDPKLQRKVALKILRDTSGMAPSWVERFSREARAMAKLRHPNIVGVHDIGEHRGRHYFAMDYVEGRSLGDALEDPELDVSRKLEIIEKVARACHFAHENGVIHRDLKPNNILLDVKGEPFVTDFGIARLANDPERLTQTGTILGTAEYMSPEHVAGDPDGIGAASDVFSLGAILYEAVSGHPPFSGRSVMQTFQAISRAEPARLSEAGPDLEAVVLKALEKDPGRRYPTAAALADDLGALRDGRPVAAPRVSGFGLFLRRRRGLAVAAGALVLVILAGVGWMGWDARRRGNLEASGDAATDLETKLSLYEQAGAEEKAARVREKLRRIREENLKLAEEKKALEEKLSEKEISRPPDRIPQRSEHPPATIGLGGRAVPIPPPLLDLHDLPEKVGVLVAVVAPEGPADKAGIRKNDLIISFNGKPVTGEGDLRARMMNTRPGAPVTITFIRNIERLEVTVIPVASSKKK